MVVLDCFHKFLNCVGFLLLVIRFLVLVVLFCYFLLFYTYTGLYMATLRSRYGHYIFALWFLSSFFQSQPLQIGCLPYLHTWCGLSANLGCRSENVFTRLAGIAWHKFASGHHRTTLSAYVFATKARIDNRKKNSLNSNVSPTSSHNMVNFGPLTTETCWRVWSIPANFNRFRILAALLHGTLVVGVSQNFAVLNRWRHLYSAGRPSRWAYSLNSNVSPTSPHNMVNFGSHF